ncbi:alpha/beta fold hydrolase [Nonomuraea sp. B5E05]|uniref:alpha/beta fold hydrolase n=1 Tax=Nonomuraea sp. B5E05 TaxID=3153569 RepID=UPI00326014B4
MPKRTSLLATALVAMASLSTAPMAGVGNAAVAGEGVTDAVGKRGIAWGPCEDEPTVECGKLAVPIDWSKPDGPTVDLALARRRTTDPSARIGSLLTNPGGPGNSGVNDILRPSGFSEEVQRRFDIVSYDPRGVGRSGAATCSASVYNKIPYEVMTSQADYDKWTAFNKKLRADCRKLTGPLYDHIDSANVARDMDAIRAALGDDKLTSYGVSYGTLAQQMYAELFPNIMNEGPDWALEAKVLRALDGGPVPDDMPDPPGNGPASGEHAEFPTAILCEDYNLKLRNYKAYADVMRAANKGSASLLVGASRHDPSTPYAWSATVARQLGPKATLLSYEGWGHGICGMTDCTKAAMDKYLISLQVPAKGTRCPGEEPQG